MFDARVRPLIDPPLKAMAARLAGWGIQANQVTWAGFACGLMAVPALSSQAYGWALGLILLNRLSDGLDGPVARATGGDTDYGGYLDIVTDMIFYGAVAFGFAWADPGANALAAAFLLAGFMGASSSFLAFMAVAEKRGLKTEAQGKKAVYYLAGLMEGTETIGFFAFMCLFPALFPGFAWAFGALCFLTAFARLWTVYQTLK